MSLAPSDLFCPSCGGYVHPFLDACPACRGRSHGRYSEAARGEDLGLARLLRHPVVLERVSALTRTFALQTARGVGALSGVLGTEEEEEADLVGLLNYFAIRARYRAWLDQASPQDDLRLHLEPDRLVLHRARPADTVLDLELHTLRSIGRPVASGAPAPGVLIHGVELTGTHARQGRPVTIHLGNPGGLFSTRARPDHFQVLGWAIGILAGMAAERRWRDVGVAEHAREIGEAGAVAGPGTRPGVDGAFSVPSLPDGTRGPLAGDAATAAEGDGRPEGEVPAAG